MMRASNSSIQTFKQCRRLYELKYIYGIEPVQTAAALERGLSYHEGVEQAIKAWCAADHRYVADEPEDPKILAMVWAFRIHVIPWLEKRGIKVNEAEKWFEYETSNHNVVIGRMDGVTTDGCVIEHKTTSGLIDGSYWQRLDFDEQIPTYMIARGCKKIYYTVCATPSIRQKKNETSAEFCRRCIDWYEDNTEQKIAVLEISRSEDDLKAFAEEQDAILTEMEQAKLFYRNPSHCSKWGRLCEYAPLCLQKITPDMEFIGFKRRERYDGGSSSTPESGTENH